MISSAYRPHGHCCSGCIRRGSSIQVYCKGVGADGKLRCQKLAAFQKHQPFARLPIPKVPLEWERKHNE